MAGGFKKDGADYRIWTSNVNLLTDNQPNLSVVRLLCRVSAAGLIV
jgi:hypothetical protein